MTMSCLYDLMDDLLTPTFNFQFGLNLGVKHDGIPIASHNEA